MTGVKLAKLVIRKRVGGWVYGCDACRGRLREWSGVIGLESQEIALEKATQHAWSMHGVRL